MSDDYEYDFQSITGTLLRLEFKKMSFQSWDTTTTQVFMC